MDRTKTTTEPLPRMAHWSTGDEAKSCLVFIYGHHLGQLVALTSESLLLGRGEDCDVLIEGSGASRHHCRIRPTAVGYCIEDLGSTNGTSVNEKLVDRALLADGDLISVGESILKFVGERNVEAKYHTEFHEQLAERILVVVDDRACLALLESLLGKWGYRVVSAPTLAAGHQALLEGKPDLLIVDHLLPDGTGLDFLRRHVSALEETAVLMITGSGLYDVGLAAEAIGLDIFEQLTKRFSPACLKSKVERCLELMKAHLNTRHALRVRERFPGHLIGFLERERRRLGMELHDEMGQRLTRLKLEAELLTDRATDGEGFQESLRGVVAGLSAALDQVRFIAWGLHPRSLDTMGVAHALRLLVCEMSRVGSVQIRMFLSGLEERPGREWELAIYRIVQEALTNVLRHSQAKTAFVDVIRTAQSISITVEDDGVGFELHSHREDPDGSRSIGLLTIKERAALLGGRTEIASRPGTGTCVSVELPLAGSSGVSGR